MTSHKGARYGVHADYAMTSRYGSVFYDLLCYATTSYVMAIPLPLSLSLSLSPSLSVNKHVYTHTRTIISLTMAMRMWSESAGGSASLRSLRSGNKAWANYVIGVVSELLKLNAAARAVRARLPTRARARLRGPPPVAGGSGRSRRALALPRSGALHRWWQLGISHV